MRKRSQRTGVRDLTPAAISTARGLILIWVVLLAGDAFGAPEDFTALCSDRAAIERVYYNHRAGTKPPFEEVLPPAIIQQLVKDDLRKEDVLKKAYGVVVSPPQLETEVRRIDSRTLAPDILAELKAALGNDTHRFARTVARPIVVERFLRDRFDNDDKIHAAQRREAERARNEALASKKDGVSRDMLLAVLKQGRSNAVTETTWQLGARPLEQGQPNSDLAGIQKQFDPDAQKLSSLQTEKDRKLHFEELPAELQNVLRVQLRQPGDVSAVIETPSGFLVYVCKEKTAGKLSAAVLSLPKRSYEQWLLDQEKGAK